MDTCPNCRGDIRYMLALKEHEFINDQCKNLKFMKTKCDAQPLCSWTGELQDLGQHIKVCTVRERKCSCGSFKGNLDQIRSHMEKDCFLRKVKCEFCRGDCIFRDLELHRSLCNERPLQCDFCNMILSKKQLLVHRVRCAKNPDCICKYWYIGCSAKGTYEFVLNHEKNEAKFHLQLAMARLACIGVKSLIEEPSFRIESPSLNQELLKPRNPFIPENDNPSQNISPPLPSSNLDKDSVGEDLYCKIELLIPENPTEIPKITGMLLELNDSEILQLLTNEEQLKNRVEEALRLLTTTS